MQLAFNHLFCSLIAGLHFKHSLRWKTFNLALNTKVTLLATDTWFDLSDTVSHSRSHFHKSPFRPEGLWVNAKNKNSTNSQCSAKPRFSPVFFFFFFLKLRWRRPTHRDTLDLCKVSTWAKQSRALLFRWTSSPSLKPWSPQTEDQRLSPSPELFSISQGFRW